ncbi:MAG: hypothetical protein Q7J82_04035 [Coriobacteriia bacterium]|nr:hypothetical protein [Coriobacteriia bacterium]
MTGISRHPMRVAMMVLLTLMMLSVPVVAQARVLEYQLQFIPVGTGGVSQMIINVILTPDTELPATVRVPLPVGATVIWAGEIIGDDPALDPARETTVTAVDGGLVAEFVISEVRIAQLEADFVAPTRSGNDVSVTLPWVNTGDEATLLASVRLEPGASDVSISPKPTGDPLSNEAGETLYALDSLTLATGEAVDIKVSYDPGGSAGTSSTTIALVIAGVLLVVVLVALVFVIDRDRRRRGTTDVDRTSAFAEEDDELTF